MQTINMIIMISCVVTSACLLTLVHAEERPLVDQIAERVRLLEREFELIIRQFSRTVLGMDVHGGNVVNRSPAAASSLTARADPAAGNGIQGVPIAIPGMDVLTQLASSGGNPLAVLQQLFMGIVMQFQSILRTLTSLPGSEILGR